MERSYQNLPPEILRLTFSHLGSKDLTRAQLTCRQWSPVAQKLLYEYMRFKSKFIGGIVQMLKHHPSLAQSVKRVSFDLVEMREYYSIVKSSNSQGIRDARDRRCRVSQHYYDMLKFLRLCPNITLIKLPVDPPRLYYQGLIQLHQGGSLLRLGEIDDYCVKRNYRDELSGYHNFLSAFKNSLETMYINNQLDSIKQGSLTDSGSSLVLDDIASFTQLKQLQLKMQRYTHVHEFDSFLDNCTDRLTTLRISITEHSESHDCFIDQHHVKQLPNIKNLQVSTQASLSNQEIQYITRKFPGLQRLYICSKSIAVPLADAAGFVDYICRIPSFNIHGGVILTVEDFTAYMPQLLQCTKFERLIFSCGPISHHVGNIEDVQIEVSSSSIDIQTACAKVPLEIVLASQQDHIHSISISGDDGGPENALNGEHLGAILNKYSSLKGLYISGMNISHLEDVAVDTKRLNLHHIKMGNCQMNVDVFPRMSQRIESIQNFSLYNTQWVKNDDFGDDRNGLTLDVQMPFTKVNSLRIDAIPRNSKAIVRVVTNSITRYFYEGDGDCDEVTYSVYKRLIKKREQPRVNLCFAALSSYHI